MPPAREAFFVVAWCKHPLGASICLVQASAWCKPLLGASPRLVQASAWCKPLLEI